MKNFARPERLPNYLRRQLRPKSKLRTPWGYRRLKADSEEFSAVVKDYCDISWGKALDVVGILADSSLRRPESIYYDPDIRELSGPGSSPPEQPAQVSEVSIAD